MWANYPQYSNCPHVIFDWLIGEANLIAYKAFAEEQERNKKKVIFVVPFATPGAGKSFCLAAIMKYL